ncbi:MAG: MraY family glycosyltransferase [Candidatus Falkowbacteria bacterium]|nr:MraY family glycosyltransferase [Candidatus Falkowbacteria bacterium]
MIFYFVFFIVTFFLSWLLTIVVKELAFQYKVLDYPRGRHQHEKPTPLLGGLAIFLALAISLYAGRFLILAGKLEPRHWLGVLAGATILLIGGIIDDVKKLSPYKQFLFPLLAAVAVVVGGVGIEKITNPFGGFFYFNDWLIPAFSILWLLGMMFTTKLLDGVDGLVSSIGAVGAFIIFLFTITTRWYQPDIAFAALMLAAACLGFLVLNWSPAKIFLGESGALLIGFVLGVLSIISGGKIAIALLIMGVPILDVAWTIIRRLLAKKNPFKSADREHLHFRLLDSGLGARKTVLAFALTSFIFGLSALFLQSRGKLLSLVILGALMILAIAMFSWLDRKAKIR